jgi:hypothetical protein
MIVKAEGPSGRAKIHSDDPKHALGLVQYLRTIGYTAWIEDTNGNEIEETALKIAYAFAELGPQVLDSTYYFGMFSRSILRLERASVRVIRCTTL